VVARPGEGRWMTRAGIVAVRPQSIGARTKDPRHA
jgi:hypothetical protein